MKVAIIGAGNVGSSLARSIARAGHSVTITSNGGASAAAVADSTGATAVESNVEAAARADVIILAVPTANVIDIATGLGSAVDGKIVVDVANRPTPDESG